MKKQIAGIILVFISVISFAQKDLRPGYILLTKQDTVFGEIIYNRNATNFKYCRFMAKNDTVPVTYKPMDIHGYKYCGGKIYISKKINENDEDIPYFLELLFDSDLDLFFLLDQQKERYFFQKKNAEILEVPYEDDSHVIIEKRSYVRESKLHIGFLRYYFRDTPELLGDIDEISTLNAKNLIRLAKRYHNLHSDNNNYTNYFEKRSPVDLRLEAFGGIIFYNSKINLKSSLVPAGGINFYLNLPRISDHLYFKTGYSFHLAQDTSFNYFVSKIPLQLQYEFPYEKFTPFLSAGYYLNFVKDKFNTEPQFLISLGGGFHYRIKDRIKLSGNISAELPPILDSSFIYGISDFILISYTANLGLIFEF